MAEFDAPQSRNEAILQNILGADNILEATQSNIEEILKCILYGTPYTGEDKSRIGILLQCILNGEDTDMIPRSRNEAILIAKIKGEEYTEAPQSRIEELLIEWASAVAKTVSGNPVVINDAIQGNATDLVVEVEPQQDLHGYAQPWAAGGGKNKFDKAYLSDYDNYPTYEMNYHYTDPITLKPNTNYVISPTSTASLGSTYYVLYINPSASDPDYLVITNVDVKYPVNAGTPVIITFTTGATGVIRFGVPNSIALDAYMTIDWQIEEGSTATSWTPYSNICPITGMDSVTVTRTDGDGQQSASVSLAFDNTVYGGEVDFTSGVVTIKNVANTRALSTFNTLDTQTNTQHYCYFGEFFSNGVGRVKNDSTAISNVVPYAYNSNDAPHFYPTWNNNNQENRVELWVPIGISGSTDIQICCELNTPQTLQLTPQQLALLKGDNVLTTDGKTITLTYKATPSADSPDTPPLLGGFMLGSPNPSPDPEPAEDEPEDLIEESLEEIPEDIPEDEPEEDPVEEEPEEPAEDPEEE